LSCAFSDINLQLVEGRQYLVEVENKTYVGDRVTHNINNI